MGKLKVFLDSSVIISYFQNERDLAELFSKEVLDRVRYIINPIVYQEIILAMRRVEGLDLKKLGDSVEIVQIDRSEMDGYLEKVRSLRNLLVHTNDILILQNAISEGDYLLTLDSQLLEIREIESLKIVSPREFFNILEGRQ